MTYDVAMVTVIQNEVRWLPEWLEYHVSLGFEHFYLYDDASTDATRDALAPYFEAQLDGRFGSQVPPTWPPAALSCDPAL